MMCSTPVLFFPTQVAVVIDKATNSRVLTSLYVFLSGLIRNAVHAVGCISVSMTGQTSDFTALIS